MTEAQFKLLKSFYDFIAENFGGTPVWKEALIAEFEACALTPEQITILLNPKNGTPEFIDHFTQALNRGENELGADISKPTTQLAATLTEPLNTIANQAIYLEFGTESQIDETKKLLVPQLSEVGNTVCHNLETMLGDRITENTKTIFSQISEFTRRAQGLIDDNTERLAPITSIEELEGLHHIGPLPEGFGEVRPQP